MARQNVLFHFGWVLVFAGCGTSAPPGDHQNTSALALIRFDEPSTRLSAIRWPVSIGLPFPRCSHAGALTLSSTVPIQNQKLANWWGTQECTKWELLDLIATLPSEGVPLELRPQTAPAVGLIETLTNGLRLSTGSVTFEVSTGNATLKGVGQDKATTLNAVYESETGESYFADFSNAAVSVELNGPVRSVVKLEGWYRNARGERRLRFLIRIAGFAGLPYLRIYHTLIWTEPSNYKLRHLRLAFNLAAPLSVRNFPGWAEAKTSKDSLVLALYDYRFQTPYGFSQIGTSLSADLWPASAGLLSLAESDRVLPVHRATYLNAEQRESACDYHGTSDPKCPWDTSPVGIAKTHEVWVYSAASSRLGTSLDFPTSAAFADYAIRRVVPFVDPEYQVKTGAIPRLSVERMGETDIGRIEKGLESMFDHLTVPVEELGDFSWFTAGSLHLFSSAYWRFHDNNGYDSSRVAWRMFYRSGKRKYLEFAIRNSRHVMDVGVIHETASQSSRDKQAGHTHAYAGLPWAWPVNGDNFNVHPEYLAHYYFMTGYERALDTLRLMSQTRMALAHSNSLSCAVLSREQYGQIRPKLVYYEVFNDSRYLDAAISWADSALRCRDPQTHRFPNNNFSGFFWDAYLNLSEITGDPKYRNAIAALAPDISHPVFHSFSSLTPFLARAMEGDGAALRYAVDRVRKEADLADSNEPMIAWNGGRGFLPRARLWYPLFLNNAIELLAAWGERPLPTQSNPAVAWGSVPQAGNYPSRLVSHLAPRDPAGISRVRLKFVGHDGVQESLAPNGCSVARDAGCTTAMRIVISRLSDGEVLLQQDFSYHYFFADEFHFSFAGHNSTIQVELLGKQNVFHVVVWAENARAVAFYPDLIVRTRAPFGAGDIYFKPMGPDVTVRIPNLGQTQFYGLLPLMLFSQTDRLIGRIEGRDTSGVLSASPLTHSLSGADAIGLWHIRRGFSISSPAKFPADQEAFSVTNAHPYFSTSAENWFQP